MIIEKRIYRRYINQQRKFFILKYFSSKNIIVQNTKPFADVSRNLKLPNIILVLILKMNWQLKKEIKQRLLVEQKLQLLADTDTLTGLFNRRAFLKRYNEHEAMALRYQQPFCLVLLDLDHFKKINDSFGHDIGDRVLIEATKLLTSSLRDVDICARFGGEEFIALLPNTKLEQARVSVERIRKNMADSNITLENGRNIAFTSSFGVVEWHQEELSELLKKADKALYLAKQNGRNTIEVFS